MGTVPYTGFYVELSAECSINSTPRMAGSRPICPPGPQPHKLASARPGAVRAPPGGLGHIWALAISKGAGPHAHVARYGRRWRRDTRRDLDAISTLERSRDLYEIAKVSVDPLRPCLAS